MCMCLYTTTGLSENWALKKLRNPEQQGQHLREKTESLQIVENQMKIPILRKGPSEHVKGQKDKDEKVAEKREGLWRIKLTVINVKKSLQSSFRPCVLTSQRHRQIQSWHVSLCGDRLL